MKLFGIYKFWNSAGTHIYLNDWGTHYAVIRRSWSKFNGNRIQTLILNALYDENKFIELTSEGKYFGIYKFWNSAGTHTHKVER